MLPRYGLEPAEIDVALEWLRLNPTDKPVALQVTLQKHGGARKKGENQVDNIKLKGGTSSAYILARLDRDRPDLAAKVRAKTLSANAAIEVVTSRRYLPLPICWRPPACPAHCVGSPLANLPCYPASRPERRMGGGAAQTAGAEMSRGFHVKPCAE
jgi:hypothetical protein